MLSEIKAITIKMGSYEILVVQTENKIANPKPITNAGSRLILIIVFNLFLNNLIITFLSL